MTNGTPVLAATSPGAEGERVRDEQVERLALVLRADVDSLRCGRPDEHVGDVPDDAERPRLPGVRERGREIVLVEVGGCAPSERRRADRRESPDETGARVADDVMAGAHELFGHADERADMTGERHRTDQDPSHADTVSARNEPRAAALPNRTQTMRRKQANWARNSLFSTHCLGWDIEPARDVGCATALVPRFSDHWRVSMTPPGWYDDGSGRQRWWDGSSWTELFAPHPSAAVAQVSPAVSGPRKMSRRDLWWGLGGGAAVLVAAAVTASVLLLPGLGSGESPGDPVAQGHLGRAKESPPGPTISLLTASRSTTRPMT